MTTSPLTVVLAVFTAMAEWFATAIPTVISLFYAEGALTFLGVLAVAGLAVSVVFLLMDRAVNLNLGEFNEGKGQRFLCPQLLLLLNLN